jgi:hypothetical protein
MREEEGRISRERGEKMILKGCFDGKPKTGETERKEPPART